MLYPYTLVLYFFLMYMNDIPNNILSDIYIYADDICLMSISRDPVSSLLKLNGDLQKLQKRAIKWYVTFKVTVSKIGLLTQILNFKNILGRA